MDYVSILILPGSTFLFVFDQKDIGFFQCSNLFFMECVCDVLLCFFLYGGDFFLY